MLLIMLRFRWFEARVYICRNFTKCRYHCDLVYCDLYSKRRAKVVPLRMFVFKINRLDVVVSILNEIELEFSHDILMFKILSCSTYITHMLYFAFLNFEQFLVKNFILLRFLMPYIFTYICTCKRLFIY